MFWFVSITHFLCEYKWLPETTLFFIIYFFEFEFWTNFLFPIFYQFLPGKAVARIFVHCTHTHTVLYLRHLLCPVSCCVWVWTVRYFSTMYGRNKDVRSLHIPSSQYQLGEYMTMNIRLGMAMTADAFHSAKNLKGIASSDLAFLRTPTSLKVNNKKK